MAEPVPKTVFITGATGYLGRALIPALLARGHRVRALTREASAGRVPRGAEPVIGDALEATTFATQIAPADTLVHLVGTPHPGPGKAAQFRAVDLRSIEAAVEAAKLVGVRHFIYLSVAQPAPVMQAYIDVRAQGEAMVRASGMAATILRPWYVLGPGHRWPILLAPLYALARLSPATRETADRLGLVRLDEMVAALVAAIEEVPEGVRMLGVEAIRAIRS